MNLSAGRRLAVPIAGFAISAASVVLLVRLVKIGDVVDAMRAADRGYLALFASILLASYPLRSYRWSLVLQPVVAARQRDLLSATAIGILGNNVLPARLGDVARSMLIARRTGISAVTAVATVASERLLDVAGNLFIFAVLATMVGVPSLTGFRPLGSEAASVPPATIGAVVALIPLTCWLAWWVTRTGGRKLPAVVMELTAGLRVFADGRLLSRSAAWTLAIWILLGMSNYVGLMAFRIDVPWHAAFVALVGQAFGVAVPSSPGAIGTFHLATVLSLSLYHVPPEASVPFAVSAHAIGLVVAAAAGVPCCWYEGVSGRDLWRFRVVEQAVGTS